MNSSKDILLQPVSILNGVGKIIEQKLNKLGIYIIRDLFFHLPTKYLDKTRITPLSTIRVNDTVLVQGEITQSKIIYARKKMLLLTITDDSGYINVRFFHFSEHQKEALVIGKTIRCFGEIRRGTNGYEIIHPQYFLDSDKEVDENLTPIYPLTQGLSQKLLQTISSKALEMLPSSNIFNEIFSGEILKKYSLMSIKDALEIIHRPTPNVASRELESFTHPAKHRLIFEELLAYQLSLRELCQSKDKRRAVPIVYASAASSKFLNKLEFDLTKAQQRVMQEITSDLKSTTPMMRLVQGDVGCGKTIVAAFAALQAIESGLQVAVMAPTEILADQHCLTFTKNFSEFPVNIAFLSSKLGKSVKETALNTIKTGEANLIIGTHAIFQDQVEFNKLGLIIIDEQHRFGVEQRLRLLDKAKVSDIVPHQLIMSATPIPRTMAMAVYADLDISIIDEMPKGRKQVQTIVMSNDKRSIVVNKISNILSTGKQAYWVCPLIDTSDVLQYQAAVDIAEKLSAELVEFNVGLIHGRLKSTEKENIIQEFKQGKINLLVATTVIEVGVDIPNAVLMIIENSERLGLSQLHQLRGRVGRGDKESYCILMYQSPLSDNSRKRLEIIRNFNDGFIIAKQDLILRGIGEMFGTNQTGLNNMKIADLSRDHELLDKIRSLANYLLEKDPKSVQDLINRWFDNGTEFIKA